MLRVQQTAIKPHPTQCFWHVQVLCFFSTTDCYVKTRSNFSDNPSGKRPIFSKPAEPRALYNSSASQACKRNFHKHPTNPHCLPSMRPTMSCPHRMGDEVSTSSILVLAGYFRSFVLLNMHALFAVHCSEFQLHWSNVASLPLW